MLHLTLATASLLVGNAPVRTNTRVSASPVMMPNLEKPNFGGDSEPAQSVEGVKPPAAAISLAGKGMPLLSPIFNLEADLQAKAFNFGSYDEAEIIADIQSTISSAPVVIYTYGLSPFSTEALAVLESTGCQFNKVELGLEWFALGPKGSATRVELRKMYGQGSLPHVFIGGEWVGGLATGPTAASPGWWRAASSRASC